MILMKVMQWRCVVVGLGVLGSAVPAWSQSSDPVAEALAEVRGIKADMFARESSVLGMLPGPAELAAAQPDRLAMFRPAKQMEYAFSTDEKADLRKRFAKPDFGKKPRSRMAPCNGAGITGFHFRDITGRTEMVVVAIEPGSPADGPLKIDDIIIGANGNLFDDPMDPRPALGFALVHSQTEEFGGKLVLQVVRDGEAGNITLMLPVGPAYSRSWPYECERAGQIAAEALRCVLDHAPSAKNLAGMHGGGGFWMPLFLMASGDPEAMELVHRWAYLQTAGRDFSELPTTPGTSNWTMSYNLVNLCEYYQLTGDATVLPKIRHSVRQLELNQFKNVGTWGHGVPGGYGPVNNVGLVCFNALAMAREIGVPVDDATLVRSIRFFGKFCGTNFPYGEGSAGGHSGRMDNGMNSMAAVAFNILGEEEMARRWGRSVSYMWMGREKGHAERIFNMAWGPEGASLGSREELAVYMNNMLWYYEMMRTRDGALNFTSYGSTKGGRLSYPAGVTAAMGLAYYLPGKRIRLLGAPPSVFAGKPPAGMEDLAKLFRDKNWADLQSRIKAGQASGDAAARQYATRMGQAYERQMQHYHHVLKQVRGNLDTDPGVAEEQLLALGQLMGDATPEMVELATKLPEKAEPKRRESPPLKSVVVPESRFFDDMK